MSKCYFLYFYLFIKKNIEIADKVVALLACLLWRDAVAPLLPRKHRLTDVNTTVVHDVGLHHFVAVSLHNLRQRPA